MSTTPITLPPIPGPIPALPQGASHDQQMAHHAALMRQHESQMALLRFAQAERSIAASTRLAEAQEAVAEVSSRHVTAMERLLQDGPGTDTTMNALLKDIEQAIRSLPAAATSGTGSGDGLTAGDVAIVKGIVDAVRPTQG